VILLDTHVLLWWQAGGERLSARARRAIEAEEVVSVSPISFWEIGLLEGRGRIRLDRDVFAWVRDLLDGGRIATEPLTPAGAVLAGRLPGAGFTGDPADALIYATAAQSSMPLLTKDQRMRAFAASRRDVRTIW
jgi:PIN domain nuclease of toxin-antitoxin system